MSARFDDVVVGIGSNTASPATPAPVSSPMLAALRRAGTVHVYADSADDAEIAALVDCGDGKVVAEVDGSTANQPLIRKVVERYLKAYDVAAWRRDLKAAEPGVSDTVLGAAVYAAVCARAAHDVVNRFAAGRDWGVSLQLHISLENDPEGAKRIGRCLRRMVPSGVVKVPFAPHRPHSLLVARDLEREGIPVNFTSTFSARQVVAVALLADVSLTNIFMGRINQGLAATLVGEHVDLCAQRALRAQRQAHGVKTLLIVASVREWQTFALTAGCDVYTSPCGAIRDFMTQTEIPAAEIRSQLDTSYEQKMTIGAEPLASLGAKRIARLYDVEPEFVEFLVDLRGRAEFQAMRDGDALAKAFDEAGFGDFFYAPSAADWRELRQNKLPQLGAPLTEKLAFDTLFTLLADADFAKYQEEMDQMFPGA